MIASLLQVILFRFVAVLRTRGVCKTGCTIFCDKFEEFCLYSITPDLGLGSVAVVGLAGFFGSGTLTTFVTVILVLADCIGSFTMELMGITTAFSPFAESGVFGNCALTATM